MTATRNRLAMSAFALALTIHAHPIEIEGYPVIKSDSGDPHTPRPRSKGEKARNRRHRK
jgi:hypothetical protein